MKVAYFAESPAVQAALTIFTEVGTSHPSLPIETEAMMVAAERLSKNLWVLEKLFPNGFGAFIRDLRKWRL